ncbi:MAG TPA: hypothetical protein VKP30_12275, partial [Polyangiaceae bacterium]|nr:hypothetical protein [Polyangiaceae bacterium]
MKILSVTRSIAVVSFPAIGLLIGCGTKADHCENLGMCPTGGVGGNAETHKGGSSGTSNGGATDGGFAGLVSSAGSSVVAGAAGTTAQLPCNGACKGSTPYCDESSQICVAC